MSGKNKNIMGENNNAGEEEVIDHAENGGNDQEETQTEEEADQQEEQGDSDQDENKDDTDSDKKEEEKPAPADEEPKTRKRNIDFILDRKNKQIQKLKEKAGANSDEEDNDDEFVDPDAKEMVQKEVQKALSPFIKKQIEEEDNQEIDNFLKDNPDFKPYADRVRKYAKHPSREALPIKSIFYEVAGDDLLKIGANRFKKANDEAKETNAGGGSGDSGVTEKGVWDLSPEEFALKQEEIRNKNR